MTRVFEILGHIRQDLAYIVDIMATDGLKTQGADNCHTSAHDYKDMYVK